ncbi:hypothetical protein A3B45_00100 [Candidatus Daviesbacteria bacterium RIFCSPLOWO2_01_FULL_39_12]|uniref:Uncharacterized protein n=1 Tax=Candidatus Daviesbacteria bacterium RIFCSPLOWO2_01_FULL_39_12 TaxID=1797785 RepID=A0A1F5KNV7_9BACT|nr:MAG: hypothetical protein A3D79_02530 [Candidatus Daviesbacteria bacterium RIFCSPHIGHO2_02_FULL_39_8]OGE42598.1 MAG: hypothetical protein A3B45_00100 [Candidatus Daviesbacteria bacterium RIFCSPLOWO2_01_FULL_39_12]
MTIIKKFEPVKNEKGFSKKYILFSFLFILTLVILEIWIQNNMVLYGGKLEKISKLEESLEMENQLLENQIATQSSLTSLASKSAELGFSKVEKIQYIR